MALLNPLRIVTSDPISVPGENPRFVVASQSGTSSGDVKMYSWDRKRREMSLVGLQSDVGQIRALAWCPSPSDRSLVALGLTTGRTLLLTLSPLTLHTQTSQPAITLPIKHSRPITALSFSPVSPQYLATSLERHRSDHSLLIWDLTLFTTTLPSTTDTLRIPPKTSSSTLNDIPPKYIQSYCPAEHVNDIAFLPFSPCTLLASANNKSIRLYDLRQPSLPNGGTGWGTRAVSGLTPDGNREFRFASFENGLNGSEGVVRVWDTRKGGEVLHIGVRGGVLGLEWEGKGRLGVGSRDGVGVWEVVDGKRVDGKGERGIEEWTEIGGMRNVARPKQIMHAFTFAKAQEGNGDVLYVTKDGSINIGPITAAPAVASSSSNEFALASSHLQTLRPDLSPSPPPCDDLDPQDQSDSNSDTEEATTSETRQNRFQLPISRISSILAEAEASRSRSVSPNTLRPVPLPGTQKQEKAGRLADRGDFEGGVATGWEGLDTLLKGDVGVVMRRRAEEGYGVGDLLLNAAIASKYPGKERLAGIWEMIDHLLKIMSHRTSTTKTLSLTHAGIYPLWTTQGLNPLHTDHSLNPLSPTFSHDSTKTYTSDRSNAPSSAFAKEPIKQGSAAWEALKVNQQQQLRAGRFGGGGGSGVSSPSIGSNEEKDRGEREKEREREVEYMKVVDEVVRMKGSSGGDVRMPRTEREGVRRLILAICGEGIASGSDSRENSEGKSTRDACWAYFKGDEDEAVKILMNSTNTKTRNLAPTLAAFLSHSHKTTSSSSYFHEHWRTLVNRVDDPYVRAMMNRAGGDGWDGILKEEAVNILDRVGIAVTNLPDDELSSFFLDRFHRISTSQNPSLHTVALTGLHPLSLPILQKYLDRTSDIQTTAILSSFIPPSRLSHGERERVEKWREGYRDLLDSWGMFKERVEFDLGVVGVLADVGEGGREGDKGRGGGVCLVCNNPLTKTHEMHLAAKMGAKVGGINERVGSCTSCGQALPRCAICLKHVGVHLANRHSRSESDDGLPVTPPSLDALDEGYICCLTCRHGGHADHILSWFQGGLDDEPGHDACPVAGCDCECANI